MIERTEERFVRPEHLIGETAYGRLRCRTGWPGRSPELKSGGPRLDEAYGLDQQRPCAGGFVHARGGLPTDGQMNWILIPSDRDVDVQRRRLQLKIV
jgi:hypothetical protein